MIKGGNIIIMICLIVIICYIKKITAINIDIKICM